MEDVVVGSNLCCPLGWAVQRTSTHIHVHTWQSLSTLCCRVEWRAHLARWRAHEECALRHRPQYPKYTAHVGMGCLRWKQKRRWEWMWLCVCLCVWDLCVGVCPCDLGSRCPINNQPDIHTYTHTSNRIPSSQFYKCRIEQTDPRSDPREEEKGGWLKMLFFQKTV